MDVVGGIEEAIEKNETELSEKEESTNEGEQAQTPMHLEPKSFCEFSSVVAHLNDGMILSLSGYGPSGTLRNKQTRRANGSFSGVGGGDAAHMATLASSSPQPKTVSPKLRKKQDEEAKKIEELQQQQQVFSRLSILLCQMFFS